MKTRKIEINPVHLLLSSAFILLFFWGFKNPANQFQEENEYLTMVVRYESGKQFIEISKGEDQIDRYVLFYEDATDKEFWEYPKKDWNKSRVDLTTEFDNRFMLKHVHALEKEGWSLVSHDYSSSYYHPTGAFKVSTLERTSFFLFKR